MMVKDACETRPHSRSMRAAFALFLAMGCSHYSKGDVMLEGGVALAMTADMVTTYTATKWCTEANPIIGQCGGRIPVGIYFPLVLAAHVGLSYLIPAGRWRTTFQAVVIGTEGHAAFRNTLVEHHGNPPPKH